MAAEILVEVGNGNGSFFGLKLEPGIKYNLVMRTRMCLANVALDVSSIEQDETPEEEYARFKEAGDTRMLGLRAIWDDQDMTFFHKDKKNPQSRLGRYFPEGREITLYVHGSGTYYLCGYKTSIDYFSD